MERICACLGVGGHQRGSPDAARRARRRALELRQSARLSDVCGPGIRQGATEAWVRYMAVEFARHSVNVVSGGIIETESAEFFYRVPGIAPLKDVLSKVPKGRMVAHGQSPMPWHSS